jgi:hypothetical protein
MSSCFLPHESDSKPIGRIRARLAKGFKATRERDLAEAFMLGCLLLSVGHSRQALSVFSVLSSNEFKSNFDHCFYIIASRMACTELDHSHLEVHSFDPRWEEAQRKVGEENMAKCILIAIRNCPPPAMGARSDLSSHCVVIGYTWYFQALGYSSLGGYNLASLRAEHIAHVKLFA